MFRFSLPAKLQKFVPFAVLFLILLLIMPRSSKFHYDYRRGSEWKYETLFAQFDFPILKSQQQLQEEQSKSSTSVIPYYRYSDEVVNKNLKAVEAVQLGKHSNLKLAIISSLSSIYSKGIVSDQGVKVEKNSEPLSDDVLYIQKDKRAAKYPITEVYKVSDAKLQLLSLVAKGTETASVDSVLRVNGIYEYIVPNLIYDKQTTSLVHAESSSVVSTTSGFVSAGQLIVSNGEIVTAEIEQMLDSYKAEYNHVIGYSGPKVLLWLGNALLALALVALLYLSIYFTNDTILEDKSRLCYLLLVFLIVAAVSFMFAKSGSIFIYMVPFSLTALYLQAFFKNKVIIPMCIISYIPLMIYSQNGIALYVMYCVAGLVNLLTFKMFDRGWKQFVNALITFAVVALIFLGFRFVHIINDSITRVLVYLFIGSMLSVAGYPLIYLFEMMFDLVSNSRLNELQDTNNELLQLLQTKAPGTFHHSLNVKNMAEVAARSIGLNPLLVMTGALYHDIGKISNPLCFKENEFLGEEEHLTPYHQNRDLLVSSRDVVRHMTYGLELAKKYKLPDIITDFILTHHGTSTTGYFWTTYLNRGGDPADKAQFSYPGKKPSTKNQAILMICDSVEAAARALKDRTPEALAKRVDEVVYGKLSENQLNECDLSIRELETIVRAIKSHLVQINHDRIEYPNKL